MPPERKTHSATVQTHSRRETFNQIILMLIVVFTFRVFVVEAFVIPTGSMAPTLKGAHARFACENCGYRYDVNFSAGDHAGADISIPPVGSFGLTRIHCPNCAFPVSEENRQRVQIHYGDRILVLKYAYLMQQPRRWDVVVFKTPSDPEIYKYNQAYIKRLVGKPGEKVMILDGDIYTAPASTPNHSNWTIQRKPRHVQSALWRIIHDTDYAPLGLTPESNYSREKYGVEDYIPWKATDGSSWRYSRDGVTGARAFAFADLAGNGTLRFDLATSQDKHPLTDWLAYDQSPGQDYRWYVGDLRLAFSYTRADGPGYLDLRMSKLKDLFIARIEPDAVSLYKASVTAPDQLQLLSKAPYAFGHTPARIEFINLDYRVELLIDGKTILSTTDQQYAPDIPALLAMRDNIPAPTLSIHAQRQVCTLTHVSLWRDVYYTMRTAKGQLAYRGGSDTPVTLGHDEYFVLGDNSPLSGDGRYWDDPVSLPAEAIDAQAGVVPERFMLGKAMLVYWPAGYRLFQFGKSSLDAIPNFGEMRFIH